MVPTIERLADANGHAFEELFRIYADAIPVRGQKPRAQIAEMVVRGDYLVMIAKRADAVVGFTIMFTPPNEEYALLEYMAVHPEHRSGGVGGALVMASVEQAAARGHAWMLIEVESDREGSGEHRELNRRRQEFYRRCGCLRVAGLEYQLPLPGVGAPPAMELMVRAPDMRETPASPSTEGLPRAQFHRWLTSIYLNVYGCQHDDPRIAEMMKAVGEQVELA